MAQKRSLKKDAEGLTDLQRRFVQARIDFPELDWTDVARKAGVKIHPKRAAYEMKRMPQVKLAIAKRTRDPKTGKLPKITKEWLQEQMQTIFMDTRTPVNEKVKLLDKLGATVEGFYVPVGIKHSGKLSLEEWVAGMGGRPEEEDVAPTEVH